MVVRKKRRARPSPRVRLSKNAGINNLEELLTRNISVIKEKKVGNASILPEILYNMTPSTKDLGYRSGFSVGELLYKNSGNPKSVTPLINALENAGFSSTLYYPIRDTVVVTARRQYRINLNKKAHVFESGLIAGYLSEATGKTVSVAEKHCAYERGDVCQFIASRNQSIERGGSFDGLNDIKNTIAMGLSESRVFGNVSENYYMLEVLPFIKDPINKEIAKLLYATGMRLSAGVELKDDYLNSLASMLGIKKIKLIKKKKVIMLRLRYKTINSIKQYTEMSASLVAGMLRSMYNSTPQIIRRTNRDSSYTLDLVLK